MSIQVGINGFGRIGRVIFRTCCETPEIEVAAINDPAIELEYICYLIKFDSTHGRFKGNVSVEGNNIKINGKLIAVFHQKTPSDIPWRDAGVQYVVEASGMFTSLAKAAGHLASGGTRRVLVTAPSADVPMLILGVNDDNIRSDMKVISCASSTLYCLAPMVKLLQDAFGVDEGFVTSIHAMTPSLKPLDGLCIRGNHWRDHRSIHQNIIPATTGACKALGRIIPAVRDRLSGLAFRVPIANVSVLDISIRLNKDTSVKEIIQYIERKKCSLFRNIILVSKEKAVSSDFIGDKHSCILDADSCLQLKANFFKLICWYENEYSYACRVVDTILLSERQHYHISVLPTPKFSFVRPRSWKSNTDGTSLAKCKKNVGIECVSFPTMLLARCPRPSSRCTKRPVTASGYLSESTQVRYQSPGREKTLCDVSKPCSGKNSIEYIKNSPESQKIQEEHKKTQERLEAVKSEISKMTNMAQNLLKKTNVRRVEPVLPTITSAKDTSVISTSNVHSPVIAEPEKISETIENSKRQKATSPTTEICGDFATFKFSDIRYIRGIKEPIKNHGSEIKLPKPETPRDDNYTKLEINPLQKTCGSPIPIPKNKYLVDRNILWNKSKQPILNTVHKPKETKKDNAMDTLNKHFERVLVDASANEKENVGVTSSADEVIHIISENAESGFMPKEEVAQENKLRDTVNLKELEVKVKKKGGSILPKTGEAEGSKNAEINKNAEKKNRILSHIEIIDEKLKKRNIELVDGNRNVETNLKDNKKEVVNKYCKEGFGPSNDKNPRELTIDPIFVMSDQVSRSVSPVNTVTTITTASNVEAYRSNQDIYDKLDSASVSGSDDSFLLQEKKSQIINIADLAYSQEDLARLDKICRIIEISDELSDKLFAPLDYLHGGQADRKKWSFKDLCERIKLDEFCNNVFGKSSARVCDEY